MITEFLRRVNIPIEVLHSPTRETVERLVLDYSKEWEKMGFTSDRWMPLFKVGIDLGAVGYGHTRVDVQVVCVLTRPPYAEVPILGRITFFGSAACKRFPIKRALRI